MYFSLFSSHEHDQFARKYNHLLVFSLQIPQVTLNMILTVHARMCSIPPNDLRGFIDFNSMKGGLDATKQSRHQPQSPVLEMTAATSMEMKGLASFIIGGATKKPYIRVWTQMLGTIFRLRGYQLIHKVIARGSIYVLTRTVPTLRVTASFRGSPLWQLGL